MPIVTTRKSEAPPPTTGESIAKTAHQPKEIMHSEEIENTLLPEQFEKTCGTAVKLYNLFEKQLPTTGHVGVMIATGLASMCTNMDRQFNLVLGAPTGQGKTTIMFQFCTMPFVNYMSRTTYADYMLSYCGRFLKTAGRKLPYGVKHDIRVKWAINGEILDTSEAPDLITNRFDIITDGESIFYQNDLEKLVQLWNALIEQGVYKGGDQYSGHYIIGDPTSRKRHGINLGCTLADFHKYILSDIGWNSRCVLIVWHNTDSENKFVRYGIRHNLVSDNPEFFYDVSGLLSHLSPTKYAEIDYNNSEIIQMIEELEEMVMNIRAEVPGMRATKDVKRILKAFAWLNLDTTVKYEHVIFIKALLTSLCRRLRLEAETTHSYKDLGSRLHFQTTLLKNINYTEVQIKQDLLTKFPFWGTGKTVYKEEEISEALREINQPITSFIRVRSAPKQHQKDEPKQNKLLL